MRAYHHTYGLPALTTNCSNNYGPYQFPEKLIPLMILNALAGKPLPVYGDGQNVRDWLYVERPLRGASAAVLERGRPGETYNIGGCEREANLDVVQHALRAARRRCSRAPAAATRDLITFVTDRPGHDRRYAIDARKIERELGWRPRRLRDRPAKTVRWYLDNADWVRCVSRRVPALGRRNYGTRMTQ